jgi:glycosyltransferase involved in cell wall biosynthesis
VTTPTLTIAIPTYRRPEALRKVLARLLPQLTPACRVVVLDNASPEGWPADITACVAPYGDAVRLTRNRVNLGMSGNFLRCFESCETEWLWLLCDDDEPTATAVAEVLAHCDRHGDAAFINFTTAHVRRTAPVTATGLDALIARIDDFGLLLFASVGLYRMPAILPHLRLGFHHAYTMAPHLALVLAAARAGETCVLATSQIVEAQSVGGVAGQWSHLDACLAMNTLAELPMAPASRRRLLSMIASTLTLEAPAYQLLGRQVQGDIDGDSARYYLDQVFGRTWYGHRAWSVWVKYRLYRLMLRHPSRGFAFFQWIKRRRGRTADEMVVPDRYDRTAPPGDADPSGRRTTS